MAIFTIGLDLGQAHDYTALVVLEQTGKQHSVVELRRWPLNTPYPAIVADVVVLLRTPALRDATLVVDATGVGRPVVDMLRAAGVWCVPVMITAGMTASTDELGFQHIPKRELVSVVQVGLQTGTLKIARELPDAQTLAQELVQFQAKITDAANVVTGAWREGQHDDLVLGLALALWYATQNSGPLSWGDEED